jgi:hypothetical protein
VDDDGIVIGQLDVHRHATHEIVVLSSQLRSRELVDSRLHLQRLACELSIPVRQVLLLVVSHDTRRCSLRSFKRNREVEAGIAPGPPVNQVTHENDAITASDSAGLKQLTSFFVVAVNVAHDHRPAAHFSSLF